MSKQFSPDWMIYGLPRKRRINPASDGRIRVGIGMTWGRGSSRRKTGSSQDWIVLTLVCSNVLMVWFIGTREKRFRFYQIFNRIYKDIHKRAPGGNQKYIAHFIGRVPCSVLISLLQILKLKIFILTTEVRPGNVHRVNTPYSECFKADWSLFLIF